MGGQLWMTLMAWHHQTKIVFGACILQSGWLCIISRSARCGSLIARACVCVCVCEGGWRVEGVCEGGDGGVVSSQKGTTSDKRSKHLVFITSASCHLYHIWVMMSQPYTCVETPDTFTHMNCSRVARFVYMNVTNPLRRFSYFVDWSYGGSTVVI